jgi:hypothetical protein
MTNKLSHDTWEDTGGSYHVPSPWQQEKQARFHQPKHAHPSLSLEELQTRWSALHLGQSTRAHLEHLLPQAGGMLIVLAATEALALEQEREGQKLTSSIVAWIVEELWSLFLEEGSSHLVEAGRVLMDGMIAWNVFGHLSTWMLSWTGVSLALFGLGLYWLMCLYRPRLPNIIRSVRLSVYSVIRSIYSASNALKCQRGLVLIDSLLDQDQSDTR